MHSRDIPELLGLLFGTGEVQHRLPVLVCVALTLWGNREKRGGGGRKRGEGGKEGLDGEGRNGNI